MVAGDVFLFYIYNFPSSCSKHSTLLSYLGVAGQVAGFSVQSVSWPC